MERIVDLYLFQLYPIRWPFDKATWSSAHQRASMHSLVRQQGTRTASPHRPAIERHKRQHGRRYVNGSQGSKVVTWGSWSWEKGCETMGGWRAREHLPM